jgi:hypothetical protein
MPKVVVGFFSFTEVTDPAEHHSYNAWHQLDHMPEQFPIPGIAYGQRWVSTPACRAARSASGARLDPIHYVTLYLMAEPIDETLREFRRLGKELRELERFHQHRHAHLSGPFRVTGTAAAPRVLISAAAVPYRPHLGIHVSVQDGGVDVDLEALCGFDGVAGAWSFEDDEHTIAVSWLDVTPLVVTDRVATTVPSDAQFAGPFETITAGKWDWFDE